MSLKEKLWLPKLPQMSQATADKAIKESNKRRMAGNELKQARKRLGMTKEDVARITCMHIEEYINIELGRTNRPEIFSKIASFLREEEEFMALKNEPEIPGEFNCVVTEGDGVKVLSNNKGRHMLVLGEMN